MTNQTWESQIIDLNPEAGQIPVRSFLHMPAENTNGKLIPIDIEDPIFLNLRIGVVVVFLSFYFVVPKASLDISIRHYLDRYNPIFKHMVSHFEIPDEIFMIGVYCMDFAVRWDKFLGEG